MRLLVVAIAMSGAAQGAFAQGAASNATSPAPSPPPSAAITPGPTLTGRSAGDCMQQGQNWFTSQYTPLAVADKRAKGAALQAEQKRIVAACAAGFNMGNTAPADLSDLATYYRNVGDTTNARLALEKALSMPKAMPQRAYAKALTQQIDRLYSAATSRSYFGILDDAEKVVAQIDALPDSLIDIKLSVHQSMIGRYDYLDVADGLKNHANAVIALGRKAHKPEFLVGAFAALARSEADKLHPEAALKILDDGEKEIGTAVVKDRYNDFRNRYALIGTQAPAVTGKWWVNSEPRDAVTPGNGKVTLVEFTAHWCGPCKNSYPGLKSVAQHFAGQPFQGVMATGLYGYIGTRRPLTQEQEVEADNDYFGKEHGLPFPVAINLNAPVEKPGDFGPLLDRSYRVGGIPQIMIIDKHGVIRQIVTGWDQGNTQRFTDYITKLLAEN